MAIRFLAYRASSWHMTPNWRAAHLILLTNLRFVRFGALNRTRTYTICVLSAVPLPLGYKSLYSMAVIISSIAIEI